MPCRDYDDDLPTRNENTLKQQCDRLARIACKAMYALEKDGHADFLLLEDEEVREWWIKHKEADRKQREEDERRKAAIAEKQRLKKIKQDLIDRLTPDEKKALGL